MPTFNFFEAAKWRNQVHHFSSSSTEKVIQKWRILYFSQQLLLSPFCRTLWRFDFSLFYCYTYEHFPIKVIISIVFNKHRYQYICIHIGEDIS